MGDETIVQVNSLNATATSITTAATVTATTTAIVITTAISTAIRRYSMFLEVSVDPRG